MIADPFPVRRAAGAGRRAAAPVLTLLLSLASIGAAGQETDLQPESPATTAPVQGRIIIAGSITMAGLMRALAVELQQRHPAVTMLVQAYGSATAPPALSEGTVTIGAMSRAMTAAELAAFKQQQGYVPARLTIAYDAIIIVVNPTNPADRISLDQLDRVFSAASRCRGPAPGKPIRRWDELLPPDSPAARRLAGRFIQRFGRNTASGTYAWFRQHVLCGGRPAAGVNRLLSHRAIVDAVIATENSIAYTGFAFTHAGIKPLAIEQDQAVIRATPEAIRSGAYPLSRPLYLYLNKPPEQQPAPALRALLRLIHSAGGRDLVEQAGLVPIPEQQLERQLADLLNGTHGDGG